MNQFLKPVKQFGVIGGYDPALVHAKILRQAADHRICVGEDFPHNCPQAVARIFLFLLNQELRIFCNTGAVNDERDGMFVKQCFHIS